MKASAINVCSLAHLPGDVDFVTMPYVQSRADVDMLRKALDDAGGHGPLIQIYAQVQQCR